MSERASFISLQAQFQLYFKSPNHFGITITYQNGFLEHTWDDRVALVQVILPSNEHPNRSHNCF